MPRKPSSSGMRDFASLAVRSQISPGPATFCARLECQTSFNLSRRVPLVRAQGSRKAHKNSWSSPCLRWCSSTGAVWADFRSRCLSRHTIVLKYCIRFAPLRETIRISLAVSALGRCDANSARTIEGFYRG